MKQNIKASKKEIEALEKEGWTQKEIIVFSFYHGRLPYPGDQRNNLTITNNG